MKYQFIRLFSRAFDYIKGRSEVSHADTSHYAFVIQKIELFYLNGLIKAELTYTPVGCYRPKKRLISELNSMMMMRQFKPSHAYMLAGIDTLERCLNLNKKEQCQLYIDFVGACVNRI